MSVFKIITCPNWGAVEPRHGLSSIIWTPRPAARIIFHHTAGHHRNVDQVPTQSKLESIFYARDIQAFHMRPEPAGRGWNDSGHNFLVCRNGVILQGRWRTVMAIQHRKMVVSAHCPGQNDQIGIEHEHKGTEEMTKIQKEASAWLQAWIASQYGRTTPLPVHPHSKYFATSCPVNLAEDMAGIRAEAGRLLKIGI
jgi:hypothetical protein